MKKPVQVPEDLDEAQLEILKAVAQAWHGHTNKSCSTGATEVNPCNRKFRSRPSRFKIERLRDILGKNKRGGATEYWDFGQSLWDSYEIVTVSKRLEDGMVLEHSFENPYFRSSSDMKNIYSLRFLFNHMSSRRFSEPEDT